MPETTADIQPIVRRVVAQTRVTDIHTHLFPSSFGPECLWGVDELLTYHYLIAETLRWLDMPYGAFWALTKREQADLVWRTLFIEHSPVSESCRGVLTTLAELGIDTECRDLNEHRAFFAKLDAAEYVDRVLDLANVDSVVMTNDPFDVGERQCWLDGAARYPRFHSALRLDVLLNSWETATAQLKDWGYDVRPDFSGRTLAETRRFLNEWLTRLDAKYMAVSLPPTFAWPCGDVRGRLIEDAVIPAAIETGRPFAMMIGPKRQVNPELRLAADSVGRCSIEPVENLCARFPEAKFLVTMLARENQHELCVTARKFRNLMVFGCWWFLNNPSLIEEITRMRLEMLGVSFIPQHSDARVLDQLIYKWKHSRAIIAKVLADKYAGLAATGWRVSEQEIRRDAEDLLSANFWRFVEA